MKIVAYQTQWNEDKVLIEESTGEKVQSNDLDVLFGFLLEPMAASGWPPQYDKCIRVCWDLDGSVAPILRVLGQARCRKLHETHKCYSAPWSIFYIPSKIFSITHIPSKQRLDLYDLEQYYPDLPEPPRNAVEAQYLGDHLMEELAKMGFYPFKLTSPVGIYEECVLSHLDLPIVADMPMEAAEFAYRCAGDLWIEAHQLGYFNEVWDYDLKNAFPRVAAQLGDFRKCNWVKSANYVGKAAYGYCLCQVTIRDDVTVSPIFYEDEDGYLSSRVGTFPAYLTKGKLDYISKRKLGSWEIIDGWWAVPQNPWALPKPLEKVMKRVLARKEIGGLQGMVAKRVAVGIWGKLMEEHQDSFGSHFNPAWGAEVPAEVSLEDAEFIYRHNLQDHLIAVGVDGVLVDQEVKLRDADAGWRLSYTGPALVVSSGLVFLGDKKPKGLTLDDVLEMIREHPRWEYYSKEIMRRMTLGDALATDFDALGEERAMHSSITLFHQEHDRDFPKIPRNGEQLLRRHYQSKPIKVKE